MHTTAPCVWCVCDVVTGRREHGHIQTHTQPTEEQWDNADIFSASEAREKGKERMVQTWLEWGSQGVARRGMCVTATKERNGEHGEASGRMAWRVRHGMREVHGMRDGSIRSREINHLMLQTKKRRRRSVQREAQKKE